jgi:orotidine-5'-phosphate decarboxylase
MTFINKLQQAWSKNNSLLCVGLDSDLAKLPKHLHKLDYPVFEFNKALIDATADLVCAYKPQIAFYTAYNVEAELKMTMEYIHSNYPEVVTILDAKRGDVGNTSNMYAKEIFDHYQADATTVSPYLGLDSLTPFLDYADRGVIILCRTSNPGAKDIQDLEVNGQKLYQVVAAKAASSSWNYNNNIALVVGATYPNELQEVRALVGNMPLLIPGIGAQGGDVHATVVNGMDSQGAGMIISSSRGIIYASADTDFADAARQATQNLRDEINQYRTVTAKI